MSQVVINFDAGWDAQLALRDSEIPAEGARYNSPTLTSTPKHTHRVRRKFKDPLLAEGGERLGSQGLADSDQDMKPKACLKRKDLGFSNCLQLSCKNLSGRRSRACTFLPLQKNPTCLTSSFAAHRASLFKRNLIAFK